MGETAARRRFGEPLPLVALPLDPVELHPQLDPLLLAHRARERLVDALDTELAIGSPSSNGVRLLVACEPLAGSS